MLAGGVVIAELYSGRGRKEELVKERISILLALGGTLLVLIACGVPTHGTPGTAAHVPASALNVSLTIPLNSSGAILLGR